MRPFELEVKRFYVPGAKLPLRCECGHKFKWNGDDEYLSFPTVGGPHEESTCCPKCEEEVRFVVKLSFKLELVE